MSLPEVVATEARARVVALARGVLDRQISILEASRELSRLRFEVCTDDLDPDFLAFVGIDSETDDLPIGPVRELWAADALRRKDAEIQRAEEHYCDIATTACEKLLERFKSVSTHAPAADARKNAPG